MKLIFTLSSYVAIAKREGSFTTPAESMTSKDLQLASEIYGTNPGWCPHYARCKYQEYRIRQALGEADEASLACEEALQNMQKSPMYKSSLTNMELRVEVFDALIPWLAK